MAAKIYTKTGDKGETALVSGHRISKSNLRLDCYGTVDELNSCLGVVRSSLEDFKSLRTEMDPILSRLQNELFNLGSRLACDSEDVLKKLPHIEQSSIDFMESTIDKYTRELPELKNFILPAGVKPAAELQLARTICRRAERATVKLSETETMEPILVQYLNRLSDFLFVLSRACNFREGRAETIWNKDSGTK